MLEVAIVAMNVALHGMPVNAERTPEGWAVLKNYRESDPNYLPETEPVIVAEDQPEAVKEAI